MTDAKKERLKKQIGKRIVELREAQNLSQKNLADRLEIDRQAMYRYEVGGADPQISTLLKITEALGVTLSDFFDFGKKIFFEGK